MTGVNSAIKKARDAGLYVIALDTPPDPANTVDITFATDNFKAGKLIGQWAASPDGRQAGDDRHARPVQRQGRLGRLQPRPGLPHRDGHRRRSDPKKNGDEAKTGSYTGGTYTIVCNEADATARPTADDSAMERCLTKNPDINLVYTINEPAAVGANDALKAAGKTATIVSIDGGCAGVAAVKSGVIGATAQQYPLKMAELGVEAIAQIATRWREAEQLAGPRLLRHRCRAGDRQGRPASITIVSSD